MAKYEAKDKEEKERLRHLKKEVKPVYGQLKQAAESNDAQSIQDLAGISPSEQGHLVKNPQVLGTQKTDAVIGLQQTQGNKYVQRLANKKGQVNVDEDILKQIDARRGSGQPLGTETCSEMEESLGHDFSDVKIHADTEAANLSEQLNARAFTTGKDVFFHENAYQPSSKTGKSLLAHELSHVVQQSGGDNASSCTNILIDDSLEREADRAAATTINGGDFAVQGTASGGIQGGWFDDVIQWIAERIPGTEAHTQRRAQELHESLESAHQLLQATEGIVSDSGARGRLRQASSALERVNEPIGRYLDIRENMSDVMDVIEAMDDWSEVDAMEDPEGYAQAAGRALAAIGNLGESLSPEGAPYAAYFTLLSEMEDFFVEMYHLMEPGERFRRSGAYQQATSAERSELWTLQ